MSLTAHWRGVHALSSCNLVQVTDGRREARVANGTPMLTKITAAGCSLNACIAAMAAVHPEDLFKAAVHGTAYYG